MDYIVMVHRWNDDNGHMCPCSFSRWKPNFLCDKFPSLFLNYFSSLTLCLSACMFIFVCVCVHVCMCAHTHTYMCMCACVCMHAYMCVYAPYRVKLKSLVSNGKRTLTHRLIVTDQRTYHG